VWGTGGVQVVDPDALLEESIQWRKDAWAPTAIAPNGVGNGGVTRMWYDLAGEASWLAFKNLTDPEGGRAMGKKIVELAKKSKVLPQGSFSCPVACAYRFIVGEGPRKGYAATPGGGGENIEGSSGLMGVSDPATNYWLTDQFDSAGLDSATPGASMGLLFELYERGIATKEDTDGIECKWGNADAVYELLQKMLKREGIGAVLAEGPKAVADRFGLEAHKYAVHVKGTGYNMHDWRPVWGTLFSYGVSVAGPCHQGIGPELTAETDLGYEAPLPGDTAQGKPEAVRRMQVRKLWDDSNGTCWFVALGVPNVTNHSMRCVAAVTGGAI
jgi:aldehyde:ferredoxin oxidoreductase